MPGIQSLLPREMFEAVWAECRCRDEGKEGEGKRKNRKMAYITSRQSAKRVVITERMDIQIPERNVG